MIFNVILVFVLFSTLQIREQYFYNQNKSFIATVKIYKPVSSADERRVENLNYSFPTRFLYAYVHNNNFHHTMEFL